MPANQHLIKKLLELLDQLGKSEIKLEVLRMVLFQQQNFHPYATFLFLDLDNQRKINCHTVKQFLKEQNLEFDLEAIEFYIQSYDKDQDHALSYLEFLDSILPKSEAKFAKYRYQQSEIECEEINYETQYALARVMEHEIIFSQNIEELKQQLIQKKHSYYDIFQLLDTKGNERVYFEDLYKFFHQNNYEISDQEIQFIIMKLDKSQSQQIKFDDFKTGLLPSSQILNYQDKYFQKEFEYEFQMKTNKLINSALHLYNTTSKQQTKISQKKYNECSKCIIKHSYINPLKEKSKNEKYYKRKEDQYLDQGFRPYFSSGQQINLNQFNEQEYGEVSEDSTEKPIQKILLIDAFLELISLFLKTDSQIELAKEDLILQKDFNVLHSFQYFDENSSGSISIDKFQECLQNFGFLFVLQKHLIINQIRSFSRLNRNPIILQQI